MNSYWFQSRLTFYSSARSLNFFISLHPLTFGCFPRPDVRAVDATGHSGMELERVVHPCALGVSLPDSRQYLLLAADRLPVWPYLHSGHQHLSAAAAVYPRRGHSGEWDTISHYCARALSRGRNHRNSFFIGYRLLESQKTLFYTVNMISRDYIYNISILYYKIYLPGSFFISTVVWFLLQFDKKEMRKNYMKTKRFKVSNYRWISIFFFPGHQMLIIKSII